MIVHFYESAVGDSPLFIAGRTRVTVDGVDVTDRCVAASREEGWARCYKHGKDGRPFVDPDDPTVAACETLHGKTVRIWYEGPWSEAVQAAIEVEREKRNIVTGD